MPKRKSRIKKPPTTQGARIRAPQSTSQSSNDKRPIFSLEYLDRAEYSLAHCTQREKAALAETLDKLSQLPWLELIRTHRHGMGCEKIPQHQIRAAIPPTVTDDVNLLAFRFYAKAPMVGYRVHEIFYILWLDRGFTLYDHG